MPQLRWHLVVCMTAGALALSGCNRGNSPSEPGVSVLAEGLRVAAQGQLLPRDGVVRLNATPGDRIARVLVKSGDRVEAGQPLVELASIELRRSELALAEQRLVEAKQQLALKQLEAKQGVVAAELQLAAAQSQLNLAKSQQQLAEQGSGQVHLAQQSLDRIQRVAEDPKTRSMVNQSELDQKQIELKKAEGEQKKGEFASQSSAETAELGLRRAEQQLVAAKQSSELLESSSPIGSLEKQIELLKVQMGQSTISAPSPGEILRVTGHTGDTVSTFPIVEMASTENMICETEVHEVDIAKVKVGQNATIRTSAIAGDLKAKVVSIQRLVGVPALRSPSPLARTDYRTLVVTLELEPESAKKARDLVQLQVDVTIDVTK